MTRYLFDSTLVIAEMAEVVAWLRSLGIDPGVVPIGAEMVLDGKILKVEVHALNERGRKYVGDHDDLARSWVTVELTGPLPEFVSLEECPA